jgi:hypothetical protein
MNASRVLANEVEVSGPDEKKNVGLNSYEAKPFLEIEKTGCKS